MNHVSHDPAVAVLEQRAQAVAKREMRGLNERARTERLRDTGGAECAQLLELRGAKEKTGE